MAIVLDGTSGITNDSGYTGDGVSFADSTPANTLVTTSGGNVGIGTSSINATYLPKLQVESAASDGTGGIMIGSYLPTLTLFDYSGGAGASQIQQDGTNFLIKNGGSERARIDSSGNLLFASSSSNNIGIPSLEVGGSNGNSLITVRRSTTTGASQIVFYNPNGIVGQILTEGSSTSYVTSSDYRLKHDIQPMTGALAKVAQLKPVTYKWNADDSQSQGFIAHELQEVVPECVTGEKDAVDAEGNPQYQGIDTSFLVATLTAAIQELKGINDAQAQIITALTARVEAQEVRLTSLEGAQA
jgi:hypothetical protein